MNLSTSPPSQTTAPPAEPGQIVVFKIGGRAYGIDVGRVREIRGWQPTTELPNAPEHILGVINLRGVIVPVLDLRARLGFGVDGCNAASVVIVVEIGEDLVGFVSDAVSDILDVKPGELRPAPDHAEGAAALLKNLAIKSDEIIGLLDLEAVVGKQDLVHGSA